jgi:hypothetical protein
VSLGQLWTFLGVALPMLATLLVPMPSIDLTYQLRAGAEILGGNGIPTADTWTFTAAGSPWLDQQWGAQVLLAAVYQVGSWTGLVVLRAALVGAAFWFARSTLRAAGCGRRPATVLTLLSFIVASPALALRPQLFAIVLFAATMWILAKRREHPRRLWLIPVIAVAWANLHGSFPLVVVLVALGWLDELLRARAARSTAATQTGEPTPPGERAHSAGSPERVLGSTGIVLIGAISAVVTLVTPFGIDTWRYVVSLAANPAVSGRVSEWRPPWPLDPTGLLFYLSVVAVLAVVWLRLRADNFRIRRETIVPFATLAVFGVLGAFTGRGLAWWAIAAPVAAANLAHDGALAAALPKALEPVRGLFRDTPPGHSTRTNRLNGVLAAVLLVAAVALLPAWRPTGPSGVPIATLSFAPELLTKKLEDLVGARGIPAGVRTWNPQEWGSWLEFNVPTLSYAADSRIELFSNAMWDDFEQVATMQGDWKAILDDYDIYVVVLLPEQRAIAEALDDSAMWVVMYDEADGLIVAHPPPPGA